MTTPRNPDFSGMEKKDIAAFAKDELGIEVSTKLSKDKMIVAVEAAFDRLDAPTEEEAPAKAPVKAALPKGMVRINIIRSGVSGSFTLTVNGREHKLPAAGEATVPADMLPALRDSAIQFQEVE